MSRPNPNQRARIRAKRPPGPDFKKRVKVPGLREAIMLVALLCPDESCQHPLTIAFPHPSEPGVLITRCGKCSADWKFSPAIVEAKS